MPNEWIINDPAPGVWAVSSDRTTAYEIISVDGDTLKVRNPNIAGAHSQIQHIEDWPVKIDTGRMVLVRCPLPIPTFKANQTGQSIISNIRAGWRPRLRGKPTRPTGIGTIYGDDRPRQYWSEDTAVVVTADGNQFVPARWDAETLAAVGWQEVLDISQPNEDRHP